MRAWWRGAVVVVALLAPGPARAQDPGAPRAYLGLRGGIQSFLAPALAPALRATNPQDAYGVSVGANLTPRLGVELAVDRWEPSLGQSGLGKVGEWGIGTVVPEARLRFPLLDGRLTPYVIGGVGVAFSDFNDRKPPAFGRRTGGHDTGPVGVVGAGLESFVAGDVALGIDSRLVGGPAHELEVDGATRRARLDSLLASVSLRLFLPEAGGPDGAPGGDSGRRVYLGFRTGGALPLNRRLGGRLEARPEAASVGPFDQLYGAVVGADVNRFLSLEIRGAGYEPVLAVRGLGRVGEYAVVDVLPAVRLRYPLPDERLVPFLLAGVGVSYAELNDVKPPGTAVSLRGRDYGPMGALGLGLECRVAPHLALGAEAVRTISRDHAVVVDGRGADLNLDAFLVTLGVRIAFP